MNWVDGLIVITFVIYLAEGLRRGFFEQLMELVGFFVTIFLALWTYPVLAHWLAPHFGIQDVVAEPIAFLINWLVYQGIFSIILHIVYPLLPPKWTVNRPNHFAGIIPAFIKAYIVISLIVTMVVILPVTAQLKADVSDSQIGGHFISQSSTVESFLNKLFGRNVQQSLTFLTVPSQNEEIIQPDQRVTLNFKVDNVSSDNESEKKMLDLINQERAKVGLQPVIWDESLAVVARAHSTDMFNNGYFGHQNLSGKSPFDRMTASGISYKAAGENLAFAANVALAHNGLMNSPGHRANILSKNFGHVGIGIIDGGVYGKMFTQDFTD